MHFHDWRAARDRKAATRRLWRSRCSGLVTVPLSIGLATLVLAAGMSLVGREEDIELLRRRWRQVETGNGQVVLIAGEAGIGKSRLTAALFEDLAGAPHTRLRYFCSPQHTDSALYPIIGQIGRAAGLTHQESAARQA